MEEKFDKWNELKKEINNTFKSLIIKEKDIWWTNTGLNIWTETCWKWPNFRRPVLVLKKLSYENYIVIPLSTKIKSWTWFEEYSLNWKKYTALLYQIKMINIKRFYVKEWKLNFQKFLEIKKRLKLLLNL